jgi:acetolactate synthase-1/2/3 large subunit
VIICVGYDIVEYHPHLWHRDDDRKIVNINSSPAEVDEHYIVECGVIGHIGAALRDIASQARRHPGPAADRDLRQTVLAETADHASDRGSPVAPQKIIHDLRRALGLEDIVICDVGAHKMWMARLYQAERPNTCIISNGFAAMGIAVPGALAARLARPDSKIVAVTGDAGFLMNSQEIETAMRLGVSFVVLIWNDDSYGLIRWKQLGHFGRESNVALTNPDFVRYAESFGARGYRVEAAEDLAPILSQALADATVSVIDCPVDYRENLKLTERLGQLVCRG